MPGFDPSSLATDPSQDQSQVPPDPTQPLEQQTASNIQGAHPQQSNPNQQQQKVPDQGPPQPPQMPRPQGGMIKQFLTNFFSGAGDSMMHHVGLQTPYEQAQTDYRDKLLSYNAGQIAQQKQLMAQLAQSKFEQAQGVEITPTDAIQFPALAPMVGRRVQPKDLMGAFTGQAKTQATAAEGQANRESRETIAANKPPSASARDDRFIKLSGADASTWSSDDQRFMKGYSKFVDVNKVQPGLQRAQIMAAPRWAALDPERQAQIAVAKSLAAGPFGQQTTSFNAFVGHLGDLHDAVQELKNTDIRLINKGVNTIAKETGDPKIQGIIAKIEPVRKEFESLLLNNRALYEADRQSADVILDQNSSPAQLEVAMKSLAKTASIRLGAINSTVKRVAGADIPELLEPANGAVLEELGAEIPGYQGAGADFSKVFKSPQGPKNTRGGATRQTPTTQQNTSSFRVGQKVLIKGNLATITAVHPDGTYDAQ